MARRQLTLNEIAQRVVRAEHPDLERRDPRRFAALVEQALPRIQTTDLLACTALYDHLLRDAMVSLRHPLRQFNLDTKRLRGNREHLIERLDALQRWFLTDHDRGPFSFHRCCLMLSLDPMAVRDKLRAEGLLQAPAALIEASAQAGKPRRDVAVRRAA